jgi:polyhydroxyalkanoate synthesis repressor PhaR
VAQQLFADAKGVVNVMAYVIKRYANRKLYDPQESRYVTLDELEEMIRAGTEISVVDVATGEDLTSVILAQIILGKERNHRTALPTAFLHQLIKYGETWQDFALTSLKASLEGLMTSQREADRVLREWATQCGWMSEGRSTSNTAPRTDQQGDLDTLKHEVAVLQEQLRTIEARLKRQGR